jgi:CheY-like chemotaxis protein
MKSQDSDVVLVVEDDPATQAALAELVEFDGFAAATAANGVDAFRYLRDSPRPRFIVLDLSMPKLDGYQFLAQQKQDPALARIPVIVTTGRSPAEVSQIDADAIFFKPVDVRLFLDVISHYRGVSSNHETLLNVPESAISGRS